MEKVAIYLDANAGAPLRREVAESLLAQLQDTHRFLANPSSAHAQGRHARRLLLHARQSIAASLGPSVDPDALLLTSSGTEANQAVIQSLVMPHLAAGGTPHWILGEGEHESVYHWASWLEKEGGSVSFLPLDSEGRHRLAELPALIRPDTALVSLTWVNNETGVISEGLSEIARFLRERRIPLHVDGAQAWGKLDLDLAAFGADCVTFSGHKIGAPAGTGVVWTRQPAAIRSPIPGTQNEGRRGGTENLLGLIGLGVAAEALSPEAWTTQIGDSRRRLEQRVLEGVPGARVHGGGAPRVANTLNLGFDGVRSAGLTAALDLAGFCVSAGAACSSGVEEPSRVLRAMGVDADSARAAIRISLFEPLSDEIQDRFVASLRNAVDKLRGSR